MGKFSEFFRLFHAWTISDLKNIYLMVLLDGTFTFYVQGSANNDKKYEITNIAPVEVP